MPFLLLSFVYVKTIGRRNTFNFVLEKMQNNEDDDDKSIVLFLFSPNIL